MCVCVSVCVWIEKSDYVSVICYLPAMLISCSTKVAAIIVHTDNTVKIIDINIASKDKTRGRVWEIADYVLMFV